MAFDNAEPLDGEYEYMNPAHTNPSGPSVVW